MTRLTAIVLQDVISRYTQRLAPLRTNFFVENQILELTHASFMDGQLLRSLRSLLPNPLFFQYMNLFTTQILSLGDKCRS